MADSTQGVKSPFQSRTIIISSILGVCGALTAFIPQLAMVADFINKNGLMISSCWAVLAIVLRTISKDKIQLGD